MIGTPKTNANRNVLENRINKLYDKVQNLPLVKRTQALGQKMSNQAQRPQGPNPALVERVTKLDAAVKAKPIVQKLQELKRKQMDTAMKMKKGGTAKASRRADGSAQSGKTRCKVY